MRLFLRLHSPNAIGIKAERSIHDTLRVFRYRRLSPNLSTLSQGRLCTIPCSEVDYPEKEWRCSSISSTANGWLPECAACLDDLVWR